MKLLSVVFSFRNEEGNIRELVERVSQSTQKLENWRLEMVFVNDASTDNSEKILTELQKKHPLITLKNAESDYPSNNKNKKK